MHKISYIIFDIFFCKKRMKFYIIYDMMYSVRRRKAIER